VLGLDAFGLVVLDILKFFLPEFFLVEEHFVVDLLVPGQFLVGDLLGPFLVVVSLY